MKAPDTMRRPYTVPWLREAIEGLGGRGYAVPSEPKLGLLARCLNVGAEIYADRELVRDARARAADVDHALQVLQSWHDDRCKESEANNIPPEIVKRETQLRNKFNAYMEAYMEAITPLEVMPDIPMRPDLPMDVWLVSPSLKSWRDIVAFIAEAFAMAMEESNPGIEFGFSDNGPAVKFTVAALELIGAAPPENARQRVAQCLRDQRVAQRIREIRTKLKRNERTDL
jgi:hypothetical protein